MESRIQFRIDNETKQLAQKAAQSKGMTLSEACRNLAEQLAEEQREAESHDAWLKNKVDAAFAQLDCGESYYLQEPQAEQLMESFKDNIRAKLAKK
ncbi:type II toxin-antitoxin system RelB/DinJ family antitoxin [Rouxiella sp. Mn2063]|uniref:type II toxin-antitoxin system RelB/DinJ family antitoxin n=1 Tax=Rouxiella sp. Mn2063 TaxID=3395262 RepID=UPI003BD26CC5